MSTTLLRGGVIRPLAGGDTADWVLIEGDVIRGVGRGDAPSADRTVDLEGGTLIPAFCDGHVHLPATGLYEAGLNLRGERSVDRILDGFARQAQTGGLLFGGNFEDPLDRPLTRHELDRVAGDRPAMLARADMHSSIVSSSLLERLPLDDVEGVDHDENGQPTGYLREQASAQAWKWFDANLGAAQQQEAVRAAVRLAYSKGVASVHEMFVVEWRGWGALEVFLDAISDVALGVAPYIGTPEVDRVAEMGFDRVGGDFFLDGSFGSHTAWMKEPFSSLPPGGSSPTGISYRSDEELEAFFRRAQTLGLQAGVHAIGDAAIEQALTVWERVAADVGVDNVRNLGHRIEHFECASDDHIARAARLGLRASIQPAFDAFWGGEEGLYAQRIGRERALEMNRFGSMKNAGLVVGAGSDSTVTPLDPFLQMRALREHHVPSERMTAAGALFVHTAGGHALATSNSQKGRMEEGRHADLAWLDRDPLNVEGDDLIKTEVLGTWVTGKRVWPLDAAESA